jgi:hypothetical protein
MQFTPFKAVLAVVWLVAVGALGAVMPVTTITGWLTIVGFGLMPAVLMLRAWRQPSQTISESIQAEIRK